MERLRFKFVVLGSTDGKTNVICITSIETPKGRVYEMPDDLKPANQHTAITSLEQFAKIKNSLKKRHQSRTLWIPLNAELRKIYLDEGENLQFGEQYLDEMIEKETLPDITTTSNIPEKRNLAKTAERFLMDKFSNKTSNANQWITEFESECGRFEIVKDEEKIEILRYLLEKQCLDWYSSMLIKLTVNSEWATWKENFCETYGNKGWSQVKYAFTFKYQSGSLLEYATKKEKLLLEVNKYIDNQTMINIIVMGLPDHLIDKINRDNVNSTANLYNEIGKLDFIEHRKTFNKQKQNIYDFKGKHDKIKPCKTCENLNKGTRFHPEEKCWFNKKEEYNYNRRNSKTINNSVIDVELNYNDKKNE